jgi:hypothetical protein
MQGPQRASHHIHRKVSQNVFDAFEYAKDCGYQFNTYVVINLRDTAAASMTTRFRRIRHKYRDWLAYQATRRGLALVPLHVHTLKNPADTHPHAN